MGDDQKRLGPRPTIHPTAHVADSRLGAWTEVGARTTVSESTLGDYSYVVNDSSIIYTTIGKFTSIAAHTRINPGNHPMERASQHHFQYRAAAYELGEDDESFFDWRRGHAVTVGHDVWIGHGAVILAGVSIGTGAVVGAGAVVSKDVAPYVVTVGVPARPLRQRHPPAVQEALMRIAWWDWDHATLAARMADFRTLDAEDFCAKYDPGV